MPRRASSALTTSREAKRHLTDREAKLVAVMVSCASEGRALSRLQAGELAGYGVGEVARVQASRALSRPHVKQAIFDALKDAAVMDAPANYAALRHVADKAVSTRDKIAAARTGLELAGLVGAAPGTSGQPVALHFHLSPEARRIIEAAPVGAVTIPPPGLENIE